MPCCSNQPVRGKSGRASLLAAWAYDQAGKMSAEPVFSPTMQTNRICFVPNVAGVGGMVSFKHKLLEGLAMRSIATSQNLDDKPYQAVLIIGGARQLTGLWRAR